MSQLEAHEIATLFPTMSEVDLEHLRESMQKHGQLEEILVFEGKILDGRHRYEACLELGIAPVLREFEGTAEEAFAYSVALNLSRRHLTTVQRAAAGAGIKEFHATLLAQGDGDEGGEDEGEGAEAAATAALDHAPGGAGAGGEAAPPAAEAGEAGGAVEADGSADAVAEADGVAEADPMAEAEARGSGAAAEADLTVADDATASAVAAAGQAGLDALEAGAGPAGEAGGPAVRVRAATAPASAPVTPSGRQRRRPSARTINAKAREIASKRVGVSARAIDTAAKIKEAAPDVFQRMLTGQAGSLPEAKRVMALGPEERAKVHALVDEGASIKAALEQVQPSAPAEEGAVFLGKVTLSPGEARAFKTILEERGIKRADAAREAVVEWIARHAVASGEAAELVSAG